MLVDRHIAIWGGWIAGPAFGIAMMAAPEYLKLEPVLSGLLFWGGLVVFFVTIVVVAVLALHDADRKKRVIGPILTMALGAVVFGCGAAWYFWPQHSFDLSTLSDQEKFRRLMVLTSIRRQYIEAKGDVSPMIHAGLENPPAEWTNQKLKEMGENWQVQSIARKSADSGLFVECNLVHFPIKTPASGRVFGLNLYPVPLVNAGGGLAEYSSQPDSEMKLGPEITQAHRCVIANYGPKPLINVTMGLYIVFQEQIKNADNPNASHSGQITLERPWRIDIKKIDPVPGNQFEFYIWNMTPNFAYVSFPESATAEYIGNPERIEFRVSSTNSYPLNVAPMKDAQKAH